MPRTALLLGATGLVGGHCLRRLLAASSYTRVTTLGRRPMPQAGPGHVHHVVDFDRLGDHAALFAADDVFCCLGTTIKQAGSREAFRRVDLEYPARAARLARAKGAEQFLLVSALGADPGSLFFYNRTKGEVEETVQQLDFFGVYRFRPSLLTGDREQNRPGERWAERFLKLVDFALVGPLRHLRPTPADAVAAAMVAVAQEQPGGVRTYDPVEIRRLAGLPSSQRSSA